MLLQKVFPQAKPVVVSPRRADLDGVVHRKEILRVLERAAGDNSFIARLTHQGDEALRGYNLDWREKAALLSGDIRWIEARVGKLSQRQRVWIDCCLQQEKW
jgi:hypothetical protein